LTFFSNLNTAIFFDEHKYSSGKHPCAASNPIGNLMTAPTQTGKSSSIKSAVRLALNIPLLVLNEISTINGYSFSNIKCTDASEAWPHNSTSANGVKHLS